LPKPRSKDARLVFGSFNNAMKLSPSTVALWATVLKAAPESQLLLKAPSFRDEAVQARFRSLFSGHGIRPERLMFRGPSALQDMMQEYGDMDIALDPVPYNGGTTTLQALWMGVPVITLAGGNFAARMGASILRSLDRPAWIAKDEADYLAKAASLAGELEILRRGRARQRKEMAESPLCDIQAYVGHLEALYRRMWAAYRDGGARRILEANSGAAHAKRSARPRRRRSPGV
jgi:predicted O-linked N-acetylglucosamine transferase (SPINDLY family)